jgi:hypothetical protein
MLDVPPPGQIEAPDPTEALAALAAQIERLRRAQDDADIPGLRCRFSSLTAALAGLAAQVADLADAGASADQPVPSWLRATAAGGDALTPETARGLLDDLIVWLGAVYVRFPDGALPECWLWHPDVVEELLWLCEAWSAAYRGPGASVQRAGDWHDRLRPGVARRVRRAAEDCSLRVHLDPATPAAVPAADAASTIAKWWAGSRGPAPVPTEQQIRAADAAHRPGGPAWR